MMIHGVAVDLTPRTLDEEGGLFIEEEELSSWWGNEKNYNIQKPTIQDLEGLERVDINTPPPPEVWNKSDRHRTEKARVP